MHRNKSKFRLGKLVNKYHILDVLLYAYPHEIEHFSDLLYQLSTSMRKLFCENYTYIKESLTELELMSLGCHMN